MSQQSNQIHFDRYNNYLILSDTSQIISVAFFSLKHEFMIRQVYLLLH